ncbi:hypothetical protein [Limnoglobus roseus]|uniref:Uncharacterized protein n=1 Tax=Limnoglobus roseus TaxID=2598579 RepID=A0A5C1ACC9_9BACT|nr:hypothetical protein [Limnoglobus roseus]QEL15412.1 hypothetical protein PX52LOC_02331 [Limnoglobus roseus]
MARPDDDDARLSLFGPGAVTKLPGALTSSDAADERPDSKTVWDGDSVDDPGDVEFDRTWNVLLVQLLGRLEFGRSSLENPAHQRNPGGAVKIAAAMVNEVADFIATHVDPVKYARPIADALAAAGRFLTTAQVASAAPPKRSGFLGFFAKAEPTSTVQECQWVLRDLTLVLEKYFVLLGSCFRSQTPTLAWMDTSGVFVGELKRALSWFEAMPQ